MTATQRTGLVLGLCASLLAHGGLYLMLRWAGELPDIGIELTLPTEIELGVADGAPLPSGALGTDSAGEAPSVPPPTPAPDPAAIAPPPEPEAEEPPKPKPKPKKPKPRIEDAGVADAAQSDEDSDAKKTDAGPGGAEGTRDPQLAAYAPPGAQLALRLDMDRVRSSPLSSDASRLLAAIPDVAFLLEGSGVDPIADLSRLFIASPNLKRSSIVLAGRYVGGEDVPRRAVETLAQSRGKTVKWSKRGGIRTAPWENADETPRVLALLAPSLFAITRPDDLPRILSVARALADRNKGKNTKSEPSGKTSEDDDPAHALLAMEDDEVLSFSVENAKTFARGNAEQVPDRLTISIRVREEGVFVVSTGVFADEAAATTAHAFWDKVRTKFARHPLVALVGLSAPMHEMDVVVDGAQVVARATLSIGQTQRILAFASDMLARRPPQGASKSLESPKKSAAAEDEPKRVREATEQ